MRECRVGSGILCLVAHCVAPVVETESESLLRRIRLSSDLPGVLLFTLLGFLVMGYHPGLEDDGIYLSAVKADLNPRLFPYNANFFRLQMQATIFDGFMAHFVRWTGIPLAWAELLWQLAGLFLILWAVKKIANLLFREESARWGGVAAVAAMFTLPVTGTALYMADQHLHPRTLATAMILLAVWRILDGRRGQAAALLALAFAMHPLMAVFGISFALFLALTLTDRIPGGGRRLERSMAAGMPLRWVLESGDRSWRKALDTRRYFYLYKWTWYEWLGALAPLAFFGVLWRLALRRGETMLARFSAAVFLYACFQQALAMVLLLPAAPARLMPLQPMRYLHVEYFLFMMTAGALLGRYLLRGKAWRWAVFLVLVNSSMFAYQRTEFGGVQHLELPGRAPSNQWLQAFAWIRANTPENAYFALDPYYLEAPGEDYHCFRALAERSELADGVKDTTVVTQVPELGPIWDKQVTAQEGWQRFRLADFERLKSEFGVDWVVTGYPQPAGLECAWHNDTLAVCKIP